ncbi:unnamed protein product, partial [Meganyctiphanes norvegica]
VNMSSDFESMPISPQELFDLNKFRKLVKSYLERHHYTAAVFWADKVVSLSNAAPQDVYWLAQSYFNTKQYHRAILLINTHNLTKNPTCRYLAALCHFEVQEFQNALNLLEGSENNNISQLKSDTEILNVPEIDDVMSIKCSTQLLKGYIYEASDNRSLAAEAFRLAAQADPMCYEAIHALTQHHMLTAKEEKDLLSSLSISRTCNIVETQIVRAVYETRVNKYSNPSQPLPQLAAPLQTNTDFMTAHAEKLYYNCDFATCYRITQKVLKKDPYHTECLPVHISCLVELKQSNTLFLLAHKLVDLYPETALAWFAVGCYYYLIGKNEQARRYLSKATTLDRVFGPAWIAYGHSFAAENEHDQAMAAYFKAAQLMKGLHTYKEILYQVYWLCDAAREWYDKEFLEDQIDYVWELEYVNRSLNRIGTKSSDLSSSELTDYLTRTGANVGEACVVAGERWTAWSSSLPLAAERVAHTHRCMLTIYQHFCGRKTTLTICRGISVTPNVMSLLQFLSYDYPPDTKIASLRNVIPYNR